MTIGLHLVLVFFLFVLPYVARRNTTTPMHAVDIAVAPLPAPRPPKTQKPQPPKPPTPEPEVETPVKEKPEPAKVPPSGPVPKMKRDQKEKPSPLAKKKKLSKKAAPKKSSKKKAKTSQKTLDDVIKTSKSSKGRKKASMTADQRHYLVESIKQQFSECWSTPQRVRDAKGLVVAILLRFDSTGRVISAKLLPRKSTAKHPDFAIASASAMRAVHHPSCNPLTLPPEYYQDWKEIVMTFSTDNL
ncbi:hypothetical protein [Candidatus Hepatobacter penaei]|uniref:hypothetical protein n=1 Tax=Candidatus Hepatobacter penaei TaxID=1274402 RepID=UPI0004F272BC|nr:hypothetical protein [Candidatus Hepatobacter penaei]